jgi:hypothetical protein
MVGKRSYQPFANERLTYIRMVAMDRTTFAGFTVPTPSLFWFIEFFNSKYKATQAARTALAASLFQPVSDKFSPRAIHILLLPIQGPAPATRCPIGIKRSTRPLLVVQLSEPPSPLRGDAPQDSPVHFVDRPLAGRKKGLVTAQGLLVTYI